MRVIHLAENLKQEMFLAIRNSDTGIGNSEGNFTFAIGSSAVCRYAYLDLPFFRELDRIPDQVCQDLAEP